MRETNKGTFRKVFASILAISILLTPAVSALTPDEFKQLLQEHYLQKVSDAAMQEETIDGILKVLDDPYTKYMSAKEYQALKDSMSDQEIGGIGVSVTLVEKGLLIEEIHGDSPAQKLALQKGDIITAVNGKSAAGQSSEVITGWLRGEPGTEVSIKVLHPNGSSETYRTVRQTVVVPGTTSELIHGDVGYINCKTFGPETQKHFLEAIKSYPQANFWIVDLRSNLGGELNASAQSLGAFLGKRGVLYLKNGKDQYVLYTSQQESMTLQPTVTLTSSYTASAAEVFSAVMRDARGGLLIGEKTFGKGVAQVILDQSTNPALFKEGDAAKITAYRYFTKDGGSTADKIGVIPHLLVDAMDAGEIAKLLSTADPKAEESSHFLRLNLGGWRWYVNLTEATSAENKHYFQELLEALPPSTVIKQGTQSGDWADISVEAVVKNYGMTDYVSRSFTDLNNRSDAAKINTLATYAILHGDQKRQYRPDASMTRAELCALLVQACGLSSKRNDSSFTDVEQKAWYADEVQAVVSAGLMEGVGGGQFLPQGTVTEEELITVLARSACNLNTYLYETGKEFNPKESHVPSGYADWAQKWVWLLSESQKNMMGYSVNLLQAPPEKINPKMPATRGEAAVLLYQIFNFIGVIPD